MFNFKFKIDKNAKAMVLCFHRLGNPFSGKEPISDGLKVDCSDFEKIILWLKKEKYNFLTLDNLYELIKNKDSVLRTNKNVVITFDDGYKDNLYDLLPICEKYNVPFAVYMTANALTGNLFTWWNTLEELLLNNDSLELSDGSKYDCSTMDKKWISFWQLREKIVNQAIGKDLEKIFSTLFAKYNFNLYAYADQNYMNKDELIKISQSPLCTIAAHTCTHLNMAVADEKEIIKEMDECILQLENLTGKPIQHFAYPFGYYNNNTLKVMKNFRNKIKTFTTVNDGFVTSSTDLLEIPRISSFEKKYIYKMFNFKKYKKLRGFIRFHIKTNSFVLEILNFFQKRVFCFQIQIRNYKIKLSLGDKFSI